ncbi:flagellar motor switch protein FliN [Sphingomonas oligoaromativorans]|jgi:flagellar motor switch protein FliN/FliY|uniref:flagellar motor switch protein FliN n=1 Tax=Sphingomonas oligoaromativorans TaxID=575322 RepID=UPI001420B969|nr:flagellar motor switch protein FliN [Sphingomonas oligoaromativorans]NIJ34714.1 flagellar motor switch protein FliN/FliY [Sphingomonas oligoaromativorans]
MNEEAMTQDAEPRQLAPTQFEADPSDTPPPGPGKPGAAPTASDLQAVFDVPVKVQAVLGRSRMDIGELMRLKTGDVVELDRRVGEPADIFVNNRLIARGEVVLIDGTLGVTLTEIVRQDR